MTASWPKVYRSMVPQASEPMVPAVGPASNMLRARLPPDPRADVHPDASGHVGPTKEGLSVCPSLRLLPPSLVPERLREQRPGARGENALRVFCLGNESFVRAPIGTSLELLPTSSKHGVVQPVRSMPVQDYQQALAATQTLWVVDET
jgi:hypothetical protein